MIHALALDVGTTSLKGVLFDAAGSVVASDSAEYELLKEGADRVELDPEVYWEAAKKVIRAALARNEVGADQIVALGVTSQGETLIALDAKGRPLRRAIVWLDNRSRREAEALAEAFGPERVYRVTGQQEMVPTWTATKIAWLRRHEPRVYAAAARYLMVADYLLFRLTGEYASDRALNPSTLYYDLTTGDWWGEMLDYLGIRREQLPQLKTSGEVVGHLTAEAARETGLCARTRVTTAPIDQIAAAVGSGNLAPGVTTEITGGALALCATVGAPVYDPRRRVGLYAHAIPGRHVLLPWVPTAGMLLRWFRDELGGGRDYEALVREAAAVPPGADGLLVLPHLCGAGSPEMDPDVRGVFWGLTLGHRRGHLVRAILEAVAFVLRENLEMLADLDVPVQEVRSLGGGARSELWLQIKADVCRRDLMVMACEDASSLGTAMIALVGQGTYRSLAEASRHMVRTRRQIAHNPEASARYDAAYDGYRNLFRNTRGLFRTTRADSDLQ